MLTDRFIRNAKPGMHADEGGLYIRVLASGKKSWVRRVKVNGKDTWKTIGSYPEMGLADARKRAAGIAVGVPLDEAKKAYLAKIKVARKEQVAGLLDQIDFSLTDTRVDLVRKLQKKAETAPVHANRILTRLKEFFEFCLDNGWVVENPIANVRRKFVGGKETACDRVLTDDEIKAMDSPLLWFILVTGMHPIEALWVLEKKQTWDIPHKRTHKDGYLHTLPKSHLIQWFLRQPIELVTRNAIANSLRRAGATYRPRDLRRTLATKLSDLGVLPHVIEKLLGHKMQGVMAVYNRADYWPERHEAQRRWDKFLIGLYRARTGPSRRTPDQPSAQPAPGRSLGVQHASETASA